MRKLFAFMIVISLVLGSVSMAAAFDDVAETEYEGSVLTLTSLGLLTGFPDGTFRPDDTVTRAQFATIAVRALGLDELEAYSRGATKFPDVAATHWASGYINIASDQGIISGYTDGTFKPENPVSGVEALAMVIRVLGYEPAVTGSWPTNYLVKAFELGISRGVDFSANAPASRGIVALFLHNSLDIPLMKREMVGAVETYVPDPDSSILTTKLGYEEIVGRIVETPELIGSELDTNEVVLGEDVYTLAEGLNLDEYLGYRIHAFHKGGNIVRFNVLPASIVSGVVGAEDLGVSVTIGTTVYDWALDPTAILNLEEIDVVAVSVDGAEVKLFLDGGGDIAFLIGLDYEDPVIITSIDERFDRVVGNAGFNQRDGVTYDFIINKDGYYVEFDALEVGDVFHHFTTGGVLYMEVVTDQVAGTIEEAYVSAGNVVIVVDGEDYVCPDGIATIGTGLVLFTGIEEATIVGYIGADALLYLDRAGNVRHVLGDIEVAAPAPTPYAIVTQEAWAWMGIDQDYEYYIQVREQDGTLVRYGFDGDTRWNPTDLNDNDGVSWDPAAGLDGEWIGDGATEMPSEGDIVIIAASDGVLTTVDTVDVTVVTINDYYASITAVVDNAGPPGRLYKLDNAVVFTDPNTVATIDDVFGAEPATISMPVEFLADPDNLFVPVIIAHGDLAITPDVDIAGTGIVLRRFLTAEGAKYDILLEDDVYSIFQDAEPDYAAGDMIVFQATDGDLHDSSLVTFEIHEGETELSVFSYNESTRVLNIYVEVLGTPVHKNFLVSPDVVIYDVTGSPVMVDEDYLINDAVINVVLGTDGFVEFILIVD